MGIFAFAPVRAMANEAIATDECAPDHKLPASEWLDRLSTGWRPLRDREPGEFGMINEVENARIVFEVFMDAGYPAPIAFAAIVNGWAESALDNTAIMDDPFWYNGKPYPNGSGAIGLFQLLPSSSGAGGPSGPEQGYSRVFMDGKWAGTPWQARTYGDTPDAAGRMYYDASDPRINTERIVLEVERDGGRLMAAYESGASIAELSDIFGRDIERPQGSTRYRRQLAVAMLGSIALARNPDRFFAPEPLPPPEPPPPDCELPLDQIDILVEEHLPGPSRRPMMLLGSLLAVGTLRRRRDLTGS